MRHLGAIGFVNRLAEFAAVNFRLLADERFDFFWVVVPTFQVAAAELAFGIFFVAGALRGFLRLYFGRSGRFGFQRPPSLLARQRLTQRRLARSPAVSQLEQELSLEPSLPERRGLCRRRS